MKHFDIIKEVTKSLENEVLGLNFSNLLHLLQFKGSHLNPHVCYLVCEIEAKNAYLAEQL